MARRLIINVRCPICCEAVEVVPDAILKRQPGYKNAEFVVTRTGTKQYYHSSCWYEMIREKRPLGSRKEHVNL